MLAEKVLRLFERGERFNGAEHRGFFIAVTLLPVKLRPDGLTGQPA